MSEQYFTRPNVQPVITNIGTTPEQRQMSTSEFKAKFDEMPEAIQQYIKETLLTELDAFKQEFMTHQAENAKKHIAESGSNDDGYFVKFDDGTMVCYQFTGLDVELNVTPFGSLYRGFHTWTFPHVFHTNVKAFISSQLRLNAGIVWGGMYPDGSGSKTQQEFVLISGQTFDNLRSPCFYAIGRWK